MNARNLLLGILLAAALVAQETATVVVTILDRKLKLPAEL